MISKIKRLFHTEEGIRISSSFGYRTSPITETKEFHRGVDYATAGKKLPQYGLDDGVVIRCGYDGTGAIYAEVEYPALGYIGQYYHLDRLAVVKGQKVDENTVIGYTGTTGNSTGIHLHFGWYPISDKNINYYERKWSDFEKFNFDYEVIKVNKFVDGYQLLSWLNQKVHVYKQSDEEIGLISAGEGNATKTIDKIDNDYYNFCKVNCSYFIFDSKKSSYGEVGGREQGFTEDGKPDQKEWLDTVIDLDNNIHSGDFASWDWIKQYVKVGFSPAAVMLENGKDVEKHSIASGKQKITNKNTQTLLVRCSDGKYAFVVVEGKLDLYQCRDFVKAYGCTDMVALDSGGSSQMIVNGKKIFYTGRKLPNALTFYKKTLSKPQTDTITSAEQNNDQKELIDTLNKKIEELTEGNKKLLNQNLLLIEENTKFMMENDKLKTVLKKVQDFLKEFGG